MNAYPNLSHPSQRWCGINYGVVCPNFPCKHTECTDPDWLEACEEAIEKPEEHERAWHIYLALAKDPFSIVKKQLRPEEWALYKPRVERYHRIMTNYPKIKQELRESWARQQLQTMEDEDELLNDESLRGDPDVEALREEKIKASLRRVKL